MNRFASYLYVFVAILILLGAGWYIHDHPISVQNLSFPSLSAPCSKPLTYTVGTIDARFGLTREQVVAKLAEAAQLWNDAAGKEVLTYTPDDAHAMPVNFVYDTRQQTLTLGQKIDTTEASQDAERREIETLQAKYLAAQQAYADAVAKFNTESSAYAKEVRQVNASGGADQATYDRLQAEQKRLKQEQADLNTQGDALEQQGNELEARIKSFNASVSQINQIVNAFNSTAGGDFEEGQYVRDASGTTHIDIYAYKNQSELLHSLAHEFGHSLDLDHNQNPASIMFPYNKSSVELSADDLAGLKAACKL
ncbi:MAG: matrixin family metalloprotease [Bacillota bacterium]